MNKTHKSIWNSSLGAWVAVSEVVRSRGKTKSAVGATALALVGAFGGQAVAQTIAVTGGINSTNPQTASPWNAGSLPP
ncbi:ESPR domain-containing protein [Variovorax sp. RTB1]|uniref:ESPR domain-containing protein n=1 Tax=Variovorax sp. RTB1 TaxID=3048631 RepID=UPI003A59874E